MQVAERFSNDNSSCHLPSSAKVLALLAAGDADDATVQQRIADEGKLSDVPKFKNLLPTAIRSLAQGPMPLNECSTGKEKNGACS